VTEQVTTKPLRVEIRMEFRETVYHHRLAITEKEMLALKGPLVRKQMVRLMDEMYEALVCAVEGDEGLARFALSPEKRKWEDENQD